MAQKKKEKVQPSRRMRSVTTYDHTNPAYREAGGGESRTVPGESMTMREIVERHKRGMISKEQLRNAMFGETAEDDFDAFDNEKILHMDLPEQKELMEIMEENQRIARDIQERADQARDEADKAEKEEWEQWRSERKQRFEEIAKKRSATKSDEAKTDKTE